MISLNPGRIVERLSGSGFSGEEKATYLFLLLGTYLVPISASISGHVPGSRSGAPFLLGTYSKSFLSLAILAIGIRLCGTAYKKASRDPEFLSVFICLFVPFRIAYLIAVVIAKVGILEATFWLSIPMAPVVVKSLDLAIGSGFEIIQYLFVVRYIRRIKALIPGALFPKALVS